MRPANLALWACAAILAAPTTGWPKGPLVKIDVEGDGLTAPLEITDRRIIARFSIWNGPGVFTFSRGKMDPAAWADPSQTAGRFIDWPRGWATQRPSGLPRMEVTFYIGGRRRPNGDIDYSTSEEYVFLYEIDPFAGQGYVYLPRWKNGLIVHFVEGNWFFAAEAWDDAMIPLIAETGALRSTERGPLSCTYGTGRLAADGTIELRTRDEHGNEGTVELSPTDQAYETFKAHLGAASPGRQVEVSCWPPRS